MALENRGDPVLPLPQFAGRMLRVVLLWMALTMIGLGIGICGYMLTEGMGLIDAFLNASMILSGMGPVGELKQPSAKIFAGFYALFSGLFIVAATGFILAPVLHRALHILHADDEDDD